MIPISKPLLGKEEEKAVVEVLRSGYIAQGPKTKELEEKFSNLCKVKHSIALNSGTAALHTALKVAGVKNGDEVITVPFTFIATANSILMQNATPRFCDITDDTFTIDPNKLEESITSKTKAVIAVDLYGQLADYEKIEKICKKKGVILIEDAAQSVGANMNGKMAGSFGDAATFSFYATKNITCGEGGMMTTNNEQFAKKAALFRQHGRKDLVGYDYDDLGFNYRTTDIASAILLEQLKKLDDFTNKRIKNAKYLSDELKSVKGIRTPITKFGRHVFHQYTIVVDDFKVSRDELSQKLKEKGIASSIYYPMPLHLNSHLIKLGYKKGDFPISERMCKQVLSIPVHASLTEKDLAAIVKAIKEVANG